jgi:hypothetical protein
VIGGFAGGVPPIVACLAWQLGLVMVEYHHVPRGLLVAILTFAVCLYVIRILASGNFSIVTAEAISCYRTMVNVNSFPIFGVMAIGASRCAYFRMALGLACSHVAVVTFFTCSRHTLKNCARMAGFARHRLMGAIERECSDAMVKVAINLDDSIDLFCNHPLTSKQPNGEYSRV